MKQGRFEICGASHIFVGTCAKFFLMSEEKKDEEDSELLTQGSEGALAELTQPSASFEEEMEMTSPVFMEDVRTIML